MTILNEIRTLIKDCVDLPDDLGCPILTQAEAKRYLRLLDQLILRIALEPPPAKNNTDSKIADDRVNRCPACGFDQIEGKSVDIDGRTATQECSCLRCNTKWLDTYTLRETTILWNTSLEQST